jgi:hypothetical protein
MRRNREKLREQEGGDTPDQKRPHKGVASGLHPDGTKRTTLREAGEMLFHAKRREEEKKRVRRSPQSKGSAEDRRRGKAMKLVRTTGRPQPERPRRNPGKKPNRVKRT